MNASTPTSSSVPPWALGALLAALTAAIVWVAERPQDPGPLGFRLDDAWIHLVYARSLWEQGLLAYNDGIPATGATSPLWALLLSVVYGTTRSTEGLVLGVYALGTACWMATAALSADVGRLVGGRPVARLAALAVGTCAPLAASAFSGMEVPLTAVAMLAGVHAMLEHRPGRAGLAFAAAVIARPESALLFAAAAMLVARQPRDLVRLGAPVAAVSLLWAAYNLYATGTPLPATFHMKASPDQDWIARISNVTQMLLPLPPMWWGLGLLGLAGFRAPIDPRARFPLLAGLLYLAGNIAITRHVDTNFYHLRYLLPAVPLVLVGLSAGWHAAGHWLPTRRWAAPAAFAALCLVGLLGSARKQSYKLHNETRNINEVQRAIGEWAQRHVPEGARLAATDAGATRFFSNRFTIDLLGLNTPEYVWDDAWAKRNPVVATATMPDWVTLAEGPLAEAATFTTADYTVTAWPGMATQVVHRCTDVGRGRFEGIVELGVWCDPLRDMDSPQTRSTP